MNGVKINRASGKAMSVLGAVALVTVVSGYFQPPQADEGTGAHIFQIAIVALAATGSLFLATTDWKRPREAARALTLPGVLTAVAFAALYYLEHYR